MGRALPARTIRISSNSVDDEESWMEVKTFREIPSRGHWESSIDPHYARLRALEQIPGEPHEVVEAWAVHDGELVCGSRLFDVPDQREDVDGRPMRRNEDGSYETLGPVSTNIEHLGPV